MDWKMTTTAGNIVITVDYVYQDEITLYNFEMIDGELTFIGNKE